MKLQEYFDSAFPKEKTHIKLQNVPKNLEGHELKLENYPNLIFLGVKECPQINKINVINCPNLSEIDFNNETTKIVVDKDKCSCGDSKWSLFFSITSILMSVVVIGVLVYRRRKQQREQQEEYAKR